MPESKQSKATKLLASYSYWSYEFNKKIRHKFRNSSKTFLSSGDAVDYAYVLKVAKQAKILHLVFLGLMLISVFLILNEIHSIYQYQNSSVEEVLYYELKTPDNSIVTIIGILIFAWLSSFAYDLLRHKRIFTTANDIDETDSSNFRVPSKEQNICIFSGKKPFIGSGTISKNFSFVLSIDKAKKHGDNTTIDFSEDEIYNTIQNALSTTNQTMQKLYINGSLLNGDTNLLSAIDSGKLKQEIWQKYSEQNANSIRRYLCVSNISQSEEIQSNFFIRFVKSHNSIFVELTTTLLPPIATKYRVIEQLPQKVSFARLIGMLQSSIFMTIVYMGKSIIYGVNFVFQGLPEMISEKKSIEKQIKENPLFDYGETTTLREDVADTSLQTFYNSMDDEHLSKQVEKAFFSNLIQFLDSKNIDTSELSQQEATIINHGLIMSGGEVKADNIAVGKMSKIFGGKKS